MRKKHLEKTMYLKQSEGFTFIEVLIALAIFSIGILGVAAMQTSSTRGNSVAGRVTSNVSWATDRVEKLMALPYDNANLMPGNYSVAAATDGIDNNSDGQIDEAGETGNITIQWTITNDTPVRWTRTIQITVTRTGPGGQRSVTLTQVIPEII